MTVEGSDIARTEAHHCRYPEAAGENRRMRHDGAAQAHDASELSGGHVRDAGETDLVTEQDRVVRILPCRGDIGHEAQEDAATDPPDVLRARPQVGVLRLLEHLGVLGDRVPERRRRPVSAADSCDNALDQVVLSEDQDVYVEYRARLVGQPALHAVGAGAQLLLCFAHGPPEAGFFLRDVVGCAVGHCIEFRQRGGKDNAADRHPGAPGNPWISPTGPGGPGSCGEMALPRAA